VEAVIDWGGNVTHYNSSGIILSPTSSPINSLGYVWDGDGIFMIKVCCFCRSVVLGIPGQDDVLDSYNLQSSPEDERATNDRIYGACHLKCFLDSSWQSFWTKRRIENFVKNRGFEVVQDDAHTLLLRDHRSGSNVISPIPGVLLLASDRQIREGLDVSGSSITFRVKERNWELPSLIKNRIAESSFSDTGKMSLLRLAELFGIVDKLLDRSQASHGVLVAEKETGLYLNKGILVGTVVSSVSLSNWLTEHLREVAGIY
jgi:hypothetical protein